MGGYAEQSEARPLVSGVRDKVEGAATPHDPADAGAGEKVRRPVSLKEVWRRSHETAVAVCEGPCVAGHTEHYEASCEAAILVYAVSESHLTPRTRVSREPRIAPPARQR